MLTLLGRPYRFCDGISRRAFLRIGGLAMGGLTMPQLLRAEAEQGVGRSHKAIIMVFLPGGPPHMDMWDLKPDAPSEIRGEFNPIKTNVPGIEICEEFPKLAARADKLAILRSIVGARGPHYAFQCLTGQHNQNQPPGGWPSIGSVLSKVRGQVDPGVPAFVGLSHKTGHVPWGDPGQPGFLGQAHAPFRPNGSGKGDMVLKDMTLERLEDRKQLLSALDCFRREADTTGMIEGMDVYQQQAFGVLTSSKLVEALDITKEDPKIVERYGKGDPKPRADGAPKMTEDFLVARRLIEAGARCVTLSFSRWDWHGNNFKRGREDFPMLDGAVSALVDDLYERGLDRDVTVIVWGEFGRTPKINDKAGRDHWPKVNSALIAGGGLRTGQVIGSTDARGEEAKDRPVHFLDVFATLYKAVGVDIATTTVLDLSGRPQYFVDANQYSAIEELF